MVDYMVCPRLITGALLTMRSWVYPTEIFPLASRAKGVALSTVAFSIAGGVINEIVPYLINAIGFWVFIFFALINVDSDLCLLHR
jgi:hypothetical protein